MEMSRQEVKSKRRNTEKREGRGGRRRRGGEREGERVVGRGEGGRKRRGGRRGGRRGRGWSGPKESREEKKYEEEEEGKSSHQLFAYTGLQCVVTIVSLKSII